MTNDYKRSKFRAEGVAIDLFRKKGLPIVIVNPSAPVGPRDAKPTPTGQIIVDYLNQKLPAYLETGLNWVHVRDVAAGHILAAEKGHIGERYILGNVQGNWTMEETLAVLQEITGIAAPIDPDIVYYVIIGAASLPYVNAPEVRQLTGRDPNDDSWIQAHAEGLVAILLPGLRGRGPQRGAGRSAVVRESLAE